MMASDFIIEVSETDFEYQVLAYSQQIPVLVDFWAEWCIPCRTLGPVLEKLVDEANGAFRLAKLNVDHNQNLAMRYNVRSIPAVKAFQNGQVIAEFSGAQPEPRVREFLKNIAPSDVDLALEKAASLMQLEQWRSAEVTYREVLDKMPSQSAALLGLVKSLLIQGQTVAALDILESFPPSREFNDAQTLLPLAVALDQEQNGDLWSDNPLDAAYSRSLNLISRGNFPAAMDGILDILREEKRYRNNEARHVFVGLLELLGEKNPLTKQYRQELSLVLF
jgi:putative thioredoxin